MKMSLGIRAVILAFPIVGMFSIANGADDEFTIVPKPGSRVAPTGIETNSMATTKAEHVWLEKSLKPDDYVADAAELARVLGREDSSYAAEGITQAIKADAERAGAAFTQCLDPKNCSDPIVRLGAVRGISIANPKEGPVGKALAACVIAEKNEQARKAAAELIKSRKDRVANKALVEYYVDSFDPQGVLLQADHERAAIDAMKIAGNRALYEVLMAYVTMDVRAGTATELTPPQTVYISNGHDVNNPNGSINLPIELPILELRSVNVTLTIPAFGALKTIAGQNFHNPAQAWAWIDKQQ